MAAQYWQNLFLHQSYFIMDNFENIVHIEFSIENLSIEGNAR